MSSDTPSRRGVRRFWAYGVWYLVGLIFCIVFGSFVASRFQANTQPPPFSQLDQLIADGIVIEIPAEIANEVERQAGAPPVVMPETHAVPLVEAAFNTGNLSRNDVHFEAWGRPVPYYFEKEYYWAVPFRYAADIGFGSMKTGTATALVQDGIVVRFLWVPYWNFSGGQGR